ncbi:MAG: TetR/AcrR family transcriptional regulator [Thermoflexales bacterium]|nr:TetR/AcrR family transcriptional regulator [Thermoflexales bacterium]
MADEKPDRRVVRTQETLIHALLELTEHKNYDQITIQDIVQHANVGRSTFYAHYQNKDDLLVSGFEHQLDRLVQQIVLDEHGQLCFDTSKLFQHARGHVGIYRTLMWGTGFDLLIKGGHATLSRKIEERLALLLSARPPPSISLPVLACAMAGTLLVLLKWWLDNKMPETPERMGEIFQQLMMPGIRIAVDSSKIAGSMGAGG